MSFGTIHALPPIKRRKCQSCGGKSLPTRHAGLSLGKFIELAEYDGLHITKLYEKNKLVGVLLACCSEYKHE